MLCFLDIRVEVDVLSMVGVLQQLDHGAPLMLLEEGDDAHKVKEEYEARVFNTVASSSSADALVLPTSSQNVDRSAVGDQVSVAGPTSGMS